MGVTYFVKSALVVITIEALKGDLNQLFFNMGLVETLAYLLILGIMLPKTKLPRINLSAFWEMLKYSVQSFPGMVSDLVTLRIDIFFINSYVGPAQVGLYTVAISLANMFLYIPAAVRSVLMPHIAAHGGQEITQKLSRLLIIILGVMAVLLIPIIWVVLVPLYGEEFAFSRNLFLILLPGSIFWGIFTVLSSDVEGRGLPWRVSIVSIQSALATVVLDILLIPKMGAVGAAIASSITHCLSMVLITGVYTRLMKIKPFFLFVPQQEDFQFLLNAISTLLFRFKKVFTVER